MTREGHLRCAFHESYVVRLTPAGRGAFWTLLAHEGERLSEAVMVELLGSEWHRLCAEIALHGLGRVSEAEPSIWTFRHVPTVAERLREKDCTRRRKERPNHSTRPSNGLD